MFSIDNKEMKKLVRNLKEASRGAYPLAIRSTLNKQAYLTSEAAKKSTLKKKFNLRNKFEQNTIKYQNCKNTFKVSQMEAKAGQRSRYKNKNTDELEKQEYGKTIRSKGKYTKVATKTARTSKSYKKRIRKANLISNLNIKSRFDLFNRSIKNKYNELKQASIISRAKGSSFTIIANTSNRRKGIFRLNKGKVEPLYMFAKKTKKLKKREWLKPTAKTIMKQSQKIFQKEAKIRLEKALSKGLKR